MFDITLIEGIYNTLIKLELDGFVSTNIKLIVIDKARTRKYFVNYPTIADLYEANKDVLENVKPNRYCIVGDYPFIQTITINNTITNYTSIYQYYNISSGEPFVKDNTKYDSSRNDFYKFDKSKYIEYVKEQLIEHNNLNIILASVRMSNYVDVCYVTPDYVAKQDEIELRNSIEKQLR